MKKLLVLALVGSMTVFSMTACGGSSDPAATTEETPEATEEAAEEEAAEEETTEDAAEDSSSEEEFNMTDLESMMTEAYMGVVTDSEETVYYAGNDDGSLGVLVFLDAANAQNASFVGEVVSNDDGSLTITDQTSATSLTFTVEAQDDGTLLMDMGEELGTASLAECEISEVLSAMDTIAENSESVNSGDAATEEAATEESAEGDFNLTDLESIMTEAYMGVSEADEGVYFAGNEDGSLGILVFLDDASGQNASFVGEVTDAGDNMLTITDEQSQTTFTFGVTAQDDGTILMDMGEELGTATLGECEVSEVLDAMQSIAENSESVN